MKEYYIWHHYRQIEMTRFKFSVMVLCLTLSTCVASAQGNVSGVVKDSGGSPLAGANVAVKGTTMSTITGLNGEFNINAADDAILVITFNGYKDMEVAVANLATADLQLKPDGLISIDDYYGNDNYYALTTASTLIQVDDIETGLEADIHEFLQGRVPGLEVVDGKYRLRGGNSLTGWDEVQPLYVVDGAYELGSDMIIGALNPADIESIRVLKDAAATAQYGMMAKGGAIVIKTRRPTDKNLTVTYNGNASRNTPSGDDSKWKPYDSFYDNKFGTKHNLGFSGVAADLLPYRFSLGYNKENTIIEDYNSSRYSASFWVGPCLLDNHLSIDVNGNYRNIDTDYSSYDIGSQWLSGTISADYAVHSLEALHLNIKANTLTDFDGDNALMVDGYASFQRQFDRRKYQEFRAGTVYGKTKSESDELKFKSVYGQFNMAVSRFFMNAHARYNAYTYSNEDIKKLSLAASFGAKPVNILMLRAGFGFIGLSVGDQPKGVSDFSTLTFNLGADISTPKNRINGSADFFLHHNYENPTDMLGVESNAILNNIGAEFKIDAKIIDKEDFKLSVGGTLSCAVGFDFEANDDNSGDNDTRTYVTIGGYTMYLSGNDGESDNIVRVRAHTYGVYDPVYDQNGNRIPGMYVDHDGNGRLSRGDCVSSKRCPVPSVLGGFHTYFEIKGAYLQLNAHASLDRYNITDNSNSNDEQNQSFVGFGWNLEGALSLSNYYSDNELETSDNVRNSSFLRIDNIVLGYKIPNFGKAYIAVQNPYVFTKYDGCEPEIYNGYDSYFSYRRPTTFTVGLKLNINLND